MDFARVALLLDVVHKAASAGPSYTWFGDMAYHELRQIKEEATAKAPVAAPSYVETQLDMALKGKL